MVPRKTPRIRACKCQLTVTPFTGNLRGNTQESEEDNILCFRLVKFQIFV